MEHADIIRFLATTHPYDGLERHDLKTVGAGLIRRNVVTGETIYSHDDPLDGVYLIEDGTVEITDASGALVSILGARNHFGERGLLRDGKAATNARAASDCVLHLFPAEAFLNAVKHFATFNRYFTRGGARGITQGGILTLHVADMLAHEPITCAPDLSIKDAARLMRDERISSLGIEENDQLIGILTVRDMNNKVLAEGLNPDLPVYTIMTRNPVTLDPSALGSDVMHMMIDHRIGHLPIVENGKFRGMITQTDLTRFLATSQAHMIADLGRVTSVEEMAEVTKRLPDFLMQLVGSHLAHDVVTRKVTDVADIVTRRLLKMAEVKFGPAPVPYCWAACGSQGRREQTGVSDQDNCLIIHDSATDDDMRYFAQLATFVCDGLNACGYVYCPGDMMATADRWRQRLSVWQSYFRMWIAKPNEEAQMLASVMFDLRPIAGDETLFTELQGDTLAMAVKDSIFVAHMASNSLKHVPPLSLFRGFATIKSGEHRNTLDMKHNGVVPIVDLGRIYALKGQIGAVNTRARIDSAIEAGIVSEAGGADLLAAYDTIASVRLNHQAAQVRAGQKPDNYLTPSSLPAFERSHLRDAFVIVRTMQSALSSSAAR
ncbi:DUF294 nucleotidyltransferase-like domain-containing protein [Marivivens sp. JLT3646]|uniref:DUF294 nucleotidyltransferase-like domain-containing protein n=1 Tax=Marivivens sp. JLT3646 TaxID=1920883 RepID=UPI0007FD2103|nr:DUF294 nucleotidyltransferase-like domain-containing protein [Marivivens sp. JLT3646]APO88504.1 histidine kinase [Marivivens sp. JLT3646]OBR39304.1 histidine kinase [Donghicola sp. JL3646]